MEHFLSELESYYNKIYIKNFYDKHFFDDIIYNNLIDFLFSFQKELVRYKNANC